MLRGLRTCVPFRRVASAIHTSLHTPFDLSAIASHLRIRHLIVRAHC